MHITLLIPGFGYPSPVIGSYEVFTSAGRLWQNLLDEEETAAPFEVVTASVDGKDVDYIGGVTIRPDKAINQIRKTDLIFIPSVGLDLDGVLAKNAKMVDFLKRQASKGTCIAGVCTGVSFMAEVGTISTSLPKGKLENRFVHYQVRQYRMWRRCLCFTGCMSVSGRAIRRV